MKENIYEGLPEELVKALKRTDILAGPEQLEYFYNLYDPKTGGFYYSISSRDAEDMTPFAEGTSSVAAFKRPPMDCRSEGSRAGRAASVFCSPFSFWGTRGVSSIGFPPFL